MKAEKPETQVEIDPKNEYEKTDYVWLGCAGLITAVAAFLRFFWLELKRKSPKNGKAVKSMTLFLYETKLHCM